MSDLINRIENVKTDLINASARRDVKGAAEDMDIILNEVEALQQRNAELEAKILNLEQQKGSLVGKLRKHEYKAVVK